MQKNYVGISKDHSASMRNIAKAAARDYNSTIQVLQESATLQNQDTIVSVVSCGSTVSKFAIVEREIVNSSVAALVPMDESAYATTATGTPLFDSVGELIRLFESTPDANDPNVSFLITAITDGEENASKVWTGIKLMAKIKELQATDRWTFTFRVPRGYARQLEQRGIFGGNILEWDTTDVGLATATAATRSAFTAYYSGLSAGIQSTDKFYTNIADVSQEEVKSSLSDISGEVTLWEVSTESAIRPFVETVTNSPMIKGSAFYQLTKPESDVQSYKQIAIRDRTTGHIYSSALARTMLNLPLHGTVKVSPGTHGNYDIYIQSTSVNRKLPSGSKLLIWPNAGVLK